MQLYFALRSFPLGAAFGAGRLRAKLTISSSESGWSSARLAPRLKVSSIFCAGKSKLAPSSSSSMPSCSTSGCASPSMSSQHGSGSFSSSSFPTTDNPFRSFSASQANARQFPARRSWVARGHRNNTVRINNRTYSTFFRIGIGRILKRDQKTRFLKATPVRYIFGPPQVAKKFSARRRRRIFFWGWT